MAAFAMDPFTQQAIQLYELTEPSGTADAMNASIPRSSIYDTSGNPYSMIGIVDTLSLNRPMIAAINAGLWSPASEIYAISAANCTTGNCIFDKPYHTLAVCGECRDIADKITGVLDEDFSEDAGVYSYSTPRRTVLSHAQHSKIEALYEWMAGRSISLAGDSTSRVALGSREFIWIATRNPQCKTKSKEGCAPPKCASRQCPVSAASCVLSTCIQTYSATVTAGILNKTLIDSAPLRRGVEGDHTFCNTNLGKDCLTDTDWDSILAKNYTRDDNPDSEYLVFCKHDSGELEPYENITQECIYGIDFPVVQALQIWFQNYDFMTGLVSGEDPLFSDGPDSMTYMYNDANLTVSNLSTTFENIAKTMSTRMRKNGFANACTPAEEKILVTQTVIGIKWFRLGLPAGLVAFTLLFLSAVALRTAVEGGNNLVGEAYPRELLLCGVTGRDAYGRAAEPHNS